MNSDQTIPYLHATPEDLTFSEALEYMKDGVRMAARFLPDHFFIVIQKPDSGSMNTEPYLKLVQVVGNPDGSSPQIVECEPWEPGRRSLFSDEWYTSKFQGIDLTK